MGHEPSRPRALSAVTCDQAWQSSTMGEESRVFLCGTHFFALGGLQRGRSRPSIELYNTIVRQQCSYLIFREHHDVTVSRSRSERCVTPNCDHRPCVIGFFFKALHHPVPTSSYGMPSACWRSVNSEPACLPRLERRRFADEIC